MPGMEIKTRFGPGDVAFVPWYTHFHRVRVEFVKTLSMPGCTGEYVGVKPKVGGSEIFKADQVLTADEYQLVCAVACRKEIDWPMEVRREDGN